MSTMIRPVPHGTAAPDRHATRHWLYQRASSIALPPLGLWFLFALLALPDLDHASVGAWIAKPLQAGLMLLFTWCALWHSALGLQVVVEDYVPARRQAATLRVLRLVHWAAAIAAGLAVWQLALGRTA
jgi:succinate dehydrogenase / fumarate reductase membrane anchor subunit